MLPQTRQGKATLQEILAFLPFCAFAHEPAIPALGAQNAAPIERDTRNRGMSALGRPGCRLGKHGTSPEKHILSVALVTPCADNMAARNIHRLSVVPIEAASRNVYSCQMLSDWRPMDAPNETRT